MPCKRLVVDKLMAAVCAYDCMVDKKEKGTESRSRPFVFFLSHACITTSNPNKVQVVLGSRCLHEEARGRKKILLFLCWFEK